MIDDVLGKLKNEYCILTEQIRLAKCDNINDMINRADLHKQRISIINRIEQLTKQRGKRFKI